MKIDRWKVPFFVFFTGPIYFARQPVRVNVLPGYEKHLAAHRTRTLAVYHSLREAILNGRLPPGTGLPSTRDLAARYGLSRGTVSLAYEMLAAEGYLRSRVGSGTKVHFPGRPPAGRRHAPVWKPDLGEWGRRLPRSRQAAERPARPPGLDFTLGPPDLDFFPDRAWRACLTRALRETDFSRRTGEIDPFGLPALREAIAAHLFRRRGLTVDPADICVLNGSIQGIALIALLMGGRGRTVIVENPCHSGTRDAVRAAGGRLVALPLDAEGIRLRETHARLIFVTPSSQFPTGTVLSLDRRLRILDWARRNEALIVEDDYDSEFHRKDRPVEPLRALDRHGERVVYLGSFSKSMHPALRLGYAVLPGGLLEPFTRARRVFETQPGALIEQTALANFLQSGAFDRHLRKMVRVYSEKHARLLTLFERQLPGVFRFDHAVAGLHVFGHWNESDSALTRFRELCAREGVRWTETHRFFEHSRTPSGIFGFSHLRKNEMERGMAIMRRCYASV